MQQIRQDQIIDTKVPENPVNPLPRDLTERILPNTNASSTKKSDLVFINQVATKDPFKNDNANAISDAINQQPSQTPIPSTPQLIGIKSQTVRTNSDGTSVVDIVIDVQDINGATDYEVRLAKSAGNL